MNYVQKARNILASKIDVEDVEADLLDLYTLLVLTKGNECSFKDIHDAWSVWRDKTKPDHKSLIPYEELAHEVQMLDEEYARAVCETAREIQAPHP